MEMDCKCTACEESGRKLTISTPLSPDLATIQPSDFNPDDLSLELEWFKPNGITILPNSKETRITSNTYVFLNIFIMHKRFGLVPMEPFFVNSEPQIKLSSNPSWCAKCNRELLSYSPKTAPFSYCKITKKLLAKFRIICSSNSHFVDKQLITITAKVQAGALWVEKSISNIRINSKKPRDENDPTSFKRRRKRKLTQSPVANTAAPVTNGIILEGLNPNHGTPAGNTLVSLRGGFSMDCEVVFGNVKLKPFMQKSESYDSDDESAAKIETLLCYSPPGTPGASVPVYVKEGERVSDTLYFVYTPFKKESDFEEKVKIRNDSDVSASVVRDLSVKYFQLEQVVMSIIQQQQHNSNPSIYKSSNETAVMTMVLKSILVDIMQARATLKGIEDDMLSKSKPSAAVPTTFEIVQKYAQLNNQLTNFAPSLMNRMDPQCDNFYPSVPSKTLIDFLPRETFGKSAPMDMYQSNQQYCNFGSEIERENQILSNKIFSQFALPTPVSESSVSQPSVPIPEDNCNDIAYDFGVPTRRNNIPTAQGNGLEKLVAAIETLETPYP